jgi:hypothetical protein
MNYKLLSFSTIQNCLTVNTSWNLRYLKLDFLTIQTIPEYRNSKQSSLGSIIFTKLKQNFMFKHFKFEA